MTTTCLRLLGDAVLVLRMLFGRAVLPQRAGGLQFILPEPAPRSASVQRGERSAGAWKSCLFRGDLFCFQPPCQTRRRRSHDG